MTCCPDCPDWTKNTTREFCCMSELADRQRDARIAARKAEWAAAVRGDYPNRKTRRAAEARERRALPR
jgi:hypothetical protein